MAYTTINKSTSYFNTVLYTGNGGTNAITGVGFQPDWVSIKRRSGSAAKGGVFDVVRGVTKLLSTSLSDAEDTRADSLTAFGTDGFTLGADTGNYVNTNSETFASWNWKAGGTGSANSNGSVYSTVSVNTTAGFSIVSWTGTGANATVGHGLGAVPQVFIIKNRSVVGEWGVYHHSLTNAEQVSLFLDLNNAVSGTSASRYNNTAPTSSVFSLGSGSLYNGSGNNMIAYCFAEKSGYSKFGKYTGNGNADGTFVYTGFKPTWVLGKRTDSANNWYLFDTVRDPFNLTTKKLRPDTSAAENDNSSKAIDILSNGFKIKNSDAEFNASGGTYIYMAFGQTLVGSNNIPSTAR